MCGICGFVATSARPRGALGDTARAMSDALAHRGPDGEGVWSDEAAGIAFGHRRLAVIDPTPGGKQPMASASGRLIVTFNGEIYNYRELRTELESAGHRFRSQSDTEVLIEACERWGVEATAKRLVGIFAFALWDRRSRILSLVRDHIGVKPLYWAVITGNLVFGSELKALTAHPHWQGTIDRNALAAYFRHGYVPTPHTIYDQVYKLPPGSILRLAPGKAPAVASYWDLWAVAQDGLRERRDIAEDAAAEQLDALLRDAVKGQMIADVPLGAFLSGGIDSSTIVALMQAQSSRPIKTFTIGFHEAEYDEAKYARAVAEHLGTDHSELYATPRDARDLIPSIAEWFDEPFADSSQLPTFLVAHMARRHVTVALSGDGGDELFGGYQRYFDAERHWRRLRRLPSPLRWGAANVARAMPAPPSRKLAAILALRDEDELYRRLISQWKEPEALVIGSIEPKGVLWDRNIRRGIPGFFDRMQFLDTVTYLPDDILTKVDRTSMAVALEARVPLLDPRIVAFAWRLPRALRVRKGSGKWLLKRVLHRYVPPSLVDRPKAGFGVPIDAWLRGPLRDWAEDLLDEKRLRADGLLDAASVRRAWHEHLSGRHNRQYPLWCVLMFQDWKRRWIDQLSRSRAPLRASV